MSATERERGRWLFPAMTIACAALGIVNIVYGNVWFPGIPNLAMAVFFAWAWRLSRR